MFKTDAEEAEHRVLHQTREQAIADIGPDRYNVLIAVFADAHKNDPGTIANPLAIADLASTPTWRDYTFEPDDGTDSFGVTVLCRSHPDCYENQPNQDGRYLTLGEAVDWARKHATQHAEWDAEAGPEDDRGNFDLDNI